ADTVEFASILLQELNYVAEPGQRGGTLCCMLIGHEEPIHDAHARQWIDRKVSQARRPGTARAGHSGTSAAPVGRVSRPVGCDPDESEVQRSHDGPVTVELHHSPQGGSLPPSAARSDSASGATWHREDLTCPGAGGPDCRPHATPGAVPVPGDRPARCC